MSTDVSEALERLLAQFASRLRRVGLRTGLRDQDLDELLQEVRIRLWRALQTGEKISTVTASYVYNTGRSAAIDLIRRRRESRDERVPAQETDELMIASPTPTQLDYVVSRETVDQLDAAISSLDVSRAVAVRLYLAGYPREEIGQLLGWTEPKTRNLIYRGLADLRSRLSALGVKPETA
jgi:RNA polymerase sigma factor (sigma-70 family)